MTWIRTLRSPPRWDNPATSRPRRHQGTVMNPRLTAALLITAAVLTNAAFTVLGTVFNYPDILAEPVDDILAAFQAPQTAGVVWFAVMVPASALFPPIAIGVGRLSTPPAMKIAVPVGIAAA